MNRPVTPPRDTPTIERILFALEADSLKSRKL